MRVEKIAFSNVNDLEQLVDGKLIIRKMYKQLVRKLREIILKLLILEINSKF